LSSLGWMRVGSNVGGLCCNALHGQIELMHLRVAMRHARPVTTWTPVDGSMPKLSDAI